MTKKWIYYLSITLIAAFITLGFKTSQQTTQSWLSANEGTLHLFPSQNITDYPVSNLLFTGKSFIGFKEALAFKESQGKYKLINPFGYMGKYQFGVNALRAIGITNTSVFLNDPVLQEKAFSALLAKNKWELKDEIEKYEGTIIAGVTVTESGILAAAHLVGAGSVKKFFRSNGKRHVQDGFGTSLRSYLKNYAGYDTSAIVADDNAKVEL